MTFRCVNGNSLCHWFTLKRLPTFKKLTFIVFHLTFICCFCPCTYADRLRTWTKASLCTLAGADKGFVVRGRRSKTHPFSKASATNMQNKFICLFFLGGGGGRPPPQSASGLCIIYVWQHYLWGLHVSGKLREAGTDYTHRPVLTFVCLEASSACQVIPLIDPLWQPW